MKNSPYSWVLTFLFCLLPQVTAAQLELPKAADTAKECSICHYRWVSTFFTEHRSNPAHPAPGRPCRWYAGNVSFMS